MQSQRNNGKKKRAKEDLKFLLKSNPEMVATIAARRKKRREPLIMIVDDDQISRMLARNVIDKDFDWICAGDGHHALSEYIVNAPDVLILDIGLPDISGHKVLECIEKIDPQAYVVMLSQYRDENNVTLAVKEGAKGFVTKPFTRDKLFQYISRSPHLAKKLKRKAAGCDHDEAEE